jgi:hypothetical protein
MQLAKPVIDMATGEVPNDSPKGPESAATAARRKGGLAGGPAPAADAIHDAARRHDPERDPPLSPPSSQGGGGIPGIRVRTNQNAAPHASHRCSDLIVPPPAMTWPACTILSLWHEGQTRSRLSGSAGSGDVMGGEAVGASPGYLAAGNFRSAEGSWIVVCPS